MCWVIDWSFIPAKCKKTKNTFEFPAKTRVSIIRKITLFGPSDVWRLGCYIYFLLLLLITTLHVACVSSPLLNICWIKVLIIKASIWLQVYCGLPLFSLYKCCYKKIIMPARQTTRERLTVSPSLLGLPTTQRRQIAHAHASLTHLLLLCFT